jgi:hypothetical protein
MREPGRGRGRSRTGPASGVGVGVDRTLSGVLGLQRLAGNRAVAGMLSGAAGGGGLGPRLLQREATAPRGVTGSAMIADARAQTAGQKGKVTAGSLARAEWQSLFARHFAEPDQDEMMVESAHARYFYSTLYGWIDAQHFFAHIQYAEDAIAEAATARGGSIGSTKEKDQVRSAEEAGARAATERGISIERAQQKIRWIIGPVKNDRTIYSDFLEHDLLSPEDFLHYREGSYILLALLKDAGMDAQELALVKNFSEEQLAKLIIDSAKSAWSSEDLFSNQLGVQFFRLYGRYVNAGADPGQVRERFLAKMQEFFGLIQVVDDASAVKKEAAGLPGKERWKASKLSLEQVRTRAPELFEVNDAGHRVIARYGSAADATLARRAVGTKLPAELSASVAPSGSDGIVVTTSSSFRATVVQKLLQRGAAGMPAAVSAQITKDLPVQGKKP